MRRASRGKFLIALFIVGIYLFGHWQMQLALQRNADLIAIQKKIIDGVEKAPPQPAGHFWGDLRKAGVVNDQDAATLQKHGYEYVPVSPDSPADAVLLRQRQPGGHEKHVYADGRTGYEHTWLSPDGKYQLRDHRGPPGSQGRRVEFSGRPGAPPWPSLPSTAFSAASCGALTASSSP